MFKGRHGCDWFTKLLFENGYKFGVPLDANVSVGVVVTSKSNTIRNFLCTVQHCPVVLTSLKASLVSTSMSTLKEMSRLNARRLTGHHLKWTKNYQHHHHPFKAVYPLKHFQQHCEYRRKLTKRQVCHVGVQPLRHCLRLCQATAQLPHTPGSRKPLWITRSDSNLSTCCNVWRAWHLWQCMIFFEIRQ